MNKQTPGPWSVGVLDDHGQRCVMGSLGELFAVVAQECVHAREPEMEMNAPLIAAAPELLTACRHALSCLDRPQLYGEQDAIDALGHVIGRVQGEA
jgi:hypothetical protein